MTKASKYRGQWKTDNQRTKAEDLQKKLEDEISDMPTTTCPPEIRAEPARVASKKVYRPANKKGYKEVPRKKNY